MHRNHYSEAPNQKPQRRQKIIFFGLLSGFVFLVSAFPLHAYQEIEVKKGGTLRGLVKFPTESPPRAMYANQGDAQCPRGIPQDHLIVNQVNRGIQNVVVILDIQKGKALKPVQATVESRECRFHPRVQLATLHTNLQMVGMDPAHHIFHLYKGHAGVFAVDVSSGTRARRPLVTPGFYKLNCDRHLWTRGWVYVMDQPYVALTNAKGEFEMTDIPPGTYTVRIWHEGWVEKGTEPTGQLRLIPMKDERRVVIRKEQVTEVLLDTPNPDILYPL